MDYIVADRKKIYKKYINYHYKDKKMCDYKNKNKPSISTVEISSTWLKKFLKLNARK